MSDHHLGSSAFPPTLEPTSNDKSLATIIHILAIFGSILIPAVIWLVKKDESRFIDEHGRAALDFQLSIIIYSIAVAILSFITCGVGAFLYIPLALFDIVGCIIVALAASDGKAPNYPLSLNLLMKSAR